MTEATLQKSTRGTPVPATARRRGLGQSGRTHPTGAPAHSVLQQFIMITYARAVHQREQKSYRSYRTAHTRTVQTPNYQHQVLWAYLELGSKQHENVSPKPLHGQQLIVEDVRVHLFVFQRSIFGATAAARHSCTGLPCTGCCHRPACRERHAQRMRRMRRLCM